MTKQKEIVLAVCHVVRQQMLSITGFISHLSKYLNHQSAVFSHKN